MVARVFSLLSRSSPCQRFVRVFFSALHHLTPSSTPEPFHTCSGTTCTKGHAKRRDKRLCGYRKVAATVKGAGSSSGKDCCPVGAVGSTIGSGHQ